MSIRNTNPEIKLEYFQTPEAEIAAKINGLEEQVSAQAVTIGQLREAIIKQNEYINGILQRMYQLEQYLQGTRRQ